MHRKKALMKDIGLAIERNVGFKIFIKEMLIQLFLKILTQTSNEKVSPTFEKCLTWARIRSPFDGEKIFLKHKVTQHH
jgi:hypothetical protein